MCLAAREKYWLPVQPGGHCNSRLDRTLSVHYYIQSPLGGGSEKRWGSEKYWTVTTTSMATLACVPDKSFLLVLVAIVSLFACWASHFGPSMVSKLLYDALLWGC